jgi:RNA polymerase sigma factor (sigma-70 family)
MAIDPYKIDAGDNDEFEILYNTMQRPIYSKLRKEFGSLLSWVDIDDIYGNTMVDALQAIRKRKFKPKKGGTAEGWLLTIAMKKARDYLRTRHRKGPKLAKSDNRPPLLSYNDPNVEQAERKHLSIPPHTGADKEEGEGHEDDPREQALDSLSDNDKTILELLREGLKAKEIAERLNIKYPAVRQRIARLKKRAQNKL